MQPFQELLQKVVASVKNDGSVRLSLIICIGVITKGDREDRMNLT